MAVRLQWVGLAALLLQGCLLPQDEQVLPDLPPKKNSPPRIVRQDPMDTNTIVHLGMGCTHETFSVSVDDPDVADLIRNRWFIDPDVLFKTPGFDGRPIVPDGTSSRGTVATPPDLIFAATSDLAQANKVHHLWVVIADGEFADGDSLVMKTLTLADGGVVDNPALKDTAHWDVTTDLTPKSSGGCP